jgi:predicted metal-dependent phosphoesterase TrpH
MPKVKELTVTDATKLLKDEDAKLFKSIQDHSAAKSEADKSKTRKAVREAAIAYANADRYYRSAKNRENSASPLD